MQAGVNLTLQQQNKWRHLSELQPIWSGFFAGSWAISTVLLSISMVFSAGPSESGFPLPHSIGPAAFFLIAVIPALFMRSLWRLVTATAILVLISIGVHLARSMWLQFDFEELGALANSLGAVGGAFVALSVRRRSIKRPTANVLIARRSQIAKLSAEEAPLALHIAGGRSLAEYAVFNGRPIADVRQAAYAIHRKLGGRTSAWPINVRPVVRAEPESPAKSPIRTPSPSDPHGGILILGRLARAPTPPSSRAREAAE